MATPVFRQGTDLSVPIMPENQRGFSHSGTIHLPHELFHLGHKNNGAQRPSLAANFPRALVLYFLCLLNLLCFIFFRNCMRKQNCLTWIVVKNFTPPKHLRNGHLMTIAGSFWRRSFPRLPASVTRQFDVEPGTKVRGECHWQPQRQKTPGSRAAARPGGIE